MKNGKQKQSERATYYREMYEYASSRHSATIDSLQRNMQQYLGSDEIDGSAERAGVVRNITYELIESEISADIPLPKVDSDICTPEREANAAAIEKLCANVKRRLPFEEMNDKDERYTYIYGASVWYAEWECDGEDGGIRIYCLSPLHFIPQPDVNDISDMEYCFLRFTTTKSEVMRKYSVTAAECALLECEYESGKNPDSDTVSVIICFYRDTDGEIGKLVFSGEVVLSEHERYYERKRRVCAVCGAEEGACNCKADFITLPVSSEIQTDGKGGKMNLPYYIPHRFPIVIRRNTPEDEGVFGCSDCEKIRHQQQAINKVETRILQKLVRAGVIPVVPEDCTINMNNSIFGQVIKMRPGESLTSYGKIDTTPDVSKDIEEADRLYEQAKRVLGISNALQGSDDTKFESGYARQLKISQATSRLESKRRMKYHAYAEIYRMIFEHYLAFADRVRSFAYKDTFGVLHTLSFDRHDFIVMGEDGTLRYKDDFLFSVNLDVGGEYRREELWERNLANLTSGTLGDKESPLTLLRYWQLQELAHYPNARENVEYFRAITEERNQ